MASYNNLNKWLLEMDIVLTFVLIGIILPISVIWNWYNGTGIMELTFLLAIVLAMLLRMLLTKSMVTMRDEYAEYALLTMVSS